MNDPTHGTCAHLRIKASLCNPKSGLRLQNDRNACCGQWGVKGEQELSNDRRHEIKRKLLTLWNSIGFLVQYANLTAWDPNVADLDGLCERLGPSVISPAKDAVQPGRRIATVRAEIGLGLPVALMTPPVSRA